MIVEVLWLPSWGISGFYYQTPEKVVGDSEPHKLPLIWSQST